jgi:hypothetical protein
MPAALDDQSYFERRAGECLSQAEQSGDPAIRRLHLEFAAAYRRRARAEAGRVPRAAIPSISVQ